MLAKHLWTLAEQLYGNFSVSADVLHHDTQKVRALLEFYESGKANPQAQRAIEREIRSVGKERPETSISTLQQFKSEEAVAPLVAEIIDFFADRLKVQQREAGVRHDLIDAVFALGGEDDLVRLLARVKALQAFVGTGEGASLLAGYKRAANILRKEKWSEDEQKSLSYTPEKEESDLLAALDLAGPRAAAAIMAEDFEGAMAALAGLREPIDRFFDGVTVNDADPAKRAARLRLLARVRDAVHGVADFSRIEG